MRNSIDKWSLDKRAIFFNHKPISLCISNCLLILCVAHYILQVWLLFLLYIATAYLYCFDKFDGAIFSRAFTCRFNLLYSKVHLIRQLLRNTFLWLYRGLHRVLHLRLPSGILSSANVDTFRTSSQNANSAWEQHMIWINTEGGGVVWNECCFI